MTFDIDNLRPGLILHVRSTGFFGRSIRKMLSRKLVKAGQSPVWGNHDAILTRSPGGSYFVGDAEPMTAKWTPLSKYQAMIDAGTVEVKVLEVIDASSDEEIRAADWWDENICGTLYDFLAFPRLAYKSIFGEWLQTAAGLSWANWCSEGLARAYKESAALETFADYWNKVNPTPLTTEKRCGMYPDLPGPVTLRCITSKCMNSLHAPERLPVSVSRCGAGDLLPA